MRQFFKRVYIRLKRPCFLSGDHFSTRLRRPTFDAVTAVAFPIKSITWWLALDIEAHESDPLQKLRHARYPRRRDHHRLAGNPVRNRSSGFAGVPEAGRPTAPAGLDADTGSEVP